MERRAIYGERRAIYGALAFSRTILRTASSTTGVARIPFARHYRHVRQRFGAREWHFW
jgi:hypothetical protein